MNNSPYSQCGFQASIKINLLEVTSGGFRKGRYGLLVSPLIGLFLPCAVAAVASSD